MDVTNLQRNELKSLLQQLKRNHPTLLFRSSTENRWDPESRTIFYSITSTHPLWSMMHELGHMSLEHTSYNTDLELILMEAAAWESAQSISTKYDIAIDNDHIQDCMDSYRDWLHKRSTCPSCRQTGFQSKHTYTCINCGATWKVSSARFCRTYRKHAK